MTAAEYSDAELVSRTLAGDRDAFNRIVSRYQILICSLAYSRIGRLGQSEDVAQETFITAWKNLRFLREPDKLRAWLCGIVRNRIHKSLEREAREPAHDAAPLEAIHDSPAREALPSEQAISREEEAILWRSLGKNPRTLPRTVHPFLSRTPIHRVCGGGIGVVRGRRQTTPVARPQTIAGGSSGFRGNCIAPDCAGGGLFRSGARGIASRSGGSGGRRHGGQRNGGGQVGFSGRLADALAPFIGIAGGIMAHWLIVRAAPTARERRLKTIAFISCWVFVLAWCLPGKFAMRALAGRFQWSDPTFFAVMAGLWWFYAAIFATFFILMGRQLLAIRRQSEEEAGIPQTAGTPLTLGTRLAVVIGLYLGLFSWLIYVAWTARDQVSVGILAATMVVLGVWHFFHFRGRTGTAAMRAGIGRLALAFGVILLVLNLRLDVWLAARREVSLAEMHRLLPPWLIPVLTLALMTWIGILLALTKPKPSASRPGP